MESTNAAPIPQPLPFNENEKQPTKLRNKRNKQLKKHQSPVFGGIFKRKKKKKKIKIQICREKRIS
jgi:hypothetical protein